jgi:histone-lysine N-methyltransferase SETMAR
MDTIEYRAVIKLFVKDGLTPNKIHSKFINVYGDSSPSFSTIKKWAPEFKRGRTSLEDDPREGRPKSATTPEITEQVHSMIYMVYVYKHFSQKREKQCLQQSTCIFDKKP